jgi:hypothetical protein
VDIAAVRRDPAIDLLGYAYPFVLELLPDTMQRLAGKAAAGARIRLAFADPDSTHVVERDALEQVGGTLPGRIRNPSTSANPSTRWTVSTSACTRSTCTTRCSASTTK